MHNNNRQKNMDHLNNNINKKQKKKNCKNRKMETPFRYISTLKMWN